MDHTLTHYICVTCGTQFAATPAAPEHCPICEDERQYIGPAGATLDDAGGAAPRPSGPVIKTIEPGLTGIGTTPSFGIGQQALLVQSPGGNVLWDCVALLNDETVAAVRALGGIAAIAISHPHYYTTMVEWAREFDAPIYLHAAEREYVVRPDPAVRYWEGETQPLGAGLTLLRLGGHYVGGQVLHWAGTADGKGALLTGDILQVVSDRRWVSFMYSYPNLIPLPAATVRRMADAVAPYPFDRIHGAFDRSILADASAAVERSAQRYIAAVTTGFGT